MSLSPVPCPTPSAPPADATQRSTGEELVALAREINANQYRLVHLAARYDEELEWYHTGHKSPAGWISGQLHIHSSTAREWIRVGHALRHLPAVDAAFAAGRLSYAKVRILTRWADADNEAQLLALALDRSADRLTTAIAKLLAEGDETDEERDARLHEARSVTTWTDGDGMTIIRIALPPSIGKPIIAAVDEVVRRIADTPPEPTDDAPADAFGRRNVTEDATEGAPPAPADAFGRQNVTDDATDGGRSGNTVARSLARGRRRFRLAQEVPHTRATPSGCPR